MTRTWVSHGAGLLAVVFSAMLTEPAPAAEPGAAMVAFQSGKFLEAADAGRGALDSQGWSLAARALLAQVLVDADPRASAARLEESIALSQKALAVDADSVEARLDLAFALGIKGRRAGKLEAVRRGYAAQGKRLIDDALAQDPDNAWAHAMLGGWHYEVLRRGGTIGAKLYGANLGAGLAAFEQAMRLAPDDPAIALQYAIAILGANAERHRDKARALLAQAAQARPVDAVAAIMIAEASRLGLVMDSLGARAAADETMRRKL